MGHKLASKPNYEDQRCDHDRHDESPLETFSRRDRVDNLPAHRNLGLDVLWLELAEDVARAAALLRIDLQALPHDLAKGLRNRLGYGNLSSIAILQLGFLLGQHSNQRDPERPDIGCR